MKIERQEAFLLLRKWKEESALLSCRITRPGLFVSLVGRIDALDVDRIGLRCLEPYPGSGFVATLSDASSFEYGDPRNVPEKAETLECVLLVFFDGNEDLETSSSIIFRVLKER